MTIFAVTYRYTQDTVARDRLRTEHRDYLRDLADQQTLLISGPFGPDEEAGALLLFRADNKSEIADTVADDPFTIGGVVVETTIRAWDPVIGPLMSTL